MQYGQERSTPVRPHVSGIEADTPLIPNEVQGSREISVQLSEKTLQRLEAATNCPGLGNSMIVEAALERFLEPTPPIEGLISEHLHRIGSQLTRLESEIAIIAETVALHARYHLTVTPPMPQSQQREACVLGRDRFEELADQVDRRVRLGRPLMRETINGLGGIEPNSAIHDLDGGALRPTITREQADQDKIPARITREESEPYAVAQEGGSNPNFQHLPNAFC